MVVVFAGDFEVTEAAACERHSRLRRNFDWKRSFGVMNGLNTGAIDDGFLSDAGVAASDTGASGGVPFAGMLQSMVQQTSALDQKASQAVTGC